MKSFIVLVFVVGTALCASDSRSRRDILPGDPRYGTDYHHHHHHHEGGSNAVSNGIEVVKSIGNYAGTFSGTGPSPTRTVPVYGPPNYHIGTPIKQQTYQTADIQQSAPVHVPQQQYRPQPAPHRHPAIPAATYGVPISQSQPVQQPQQHYVQQPQQHYVQQTQQHYVQQPQQQYVQQPSYQVPAQSYGPPVQHQSVPDKHVQQLPVSRPNNAYITPAVEQKQTVSYNPPTVHYQSYQQLQHQLQQPVQQPTQQVVQHVQVQEPLNSYGVPITQAEQAAPAREYIPQSIQVESAPAPAVQRQVSFDVANDEQNEELTVPRPSGSTGHNNDKNHDKEDGHKNCKDHGGSGHFPSFGPIDINQLTAMIAPLGQQLPGGIASNGGNGIGSLGSPSLPGFPSVSITDISNIFSPKPASNGGHGKAIANEESFRTLPVFKIQSGSADNYQQEVGSSRSGVSNSGSSGYSRENPQPTHQYLSPVQQVAFAPASEAAIIDSPPPPQQQQQQPQQQQQQQQQPQQESTQLVDSNGGYVY